MSEEFIRGAVRAPIGRYGGALASIRRNDRAALRLALGTTCTGVRQGMAMINERV